MCGLHREDSNEEDKSEVVEVALNPEPIVEVAPIADVKPADIEHVSLPIQPTLESISLLLLSHEG